MKEFIYILYSCDNEGREEVFYVGITTRPEKRLQEHRYESKKGHTAKYVHIRFLESKGYRWDMKVIRKIEDDVYPPDYERFYVIDFLRKGFDLTNMRHGNAEKRKEISEQVDDVAIRTVSDAKRDRINREKDKRSNLREREFKRALREEGIPSVAECLFIPEELRDGLLAGSSGRDFRIEKGVDYEWLQQSATKEGIETNLRLQRLLEGKD